MELEKDMPICRRCGRRLKTLEARERGMGKVCWEKSKISEQPKALFVIGDSYAESNPRV